MSSFRAGASTVMCALALAACRGDGASERPASTTDTPRSETPGPDRAPSPPVASGETWNGITLYPGSRQLCDQHVMASSASAPREIEWRSYATSDPADRVVAHFDPDGKLVDSKLDGETTLRLDGVQISIFSLPTSRPAPSCDVTPATTDRALIVLHRQTAP